jgi:large subunit ribosomal protein L35
MKNKMKSHRGASKRLKVTKNGKGSKIRALRRAFTSHLAPHKSTKQKRHLRKKIMLSKGDSKSLKQMIAGN